MIPLNGEGVYRCALIVCLDVRQAKGLRMSCLMMRYKAYLGARCRLEYLAHAIVPQMHNGEYEGYCEDKMHMIYRVISYLRVIPLISLSQFTILSCWPFVTSFPTIPARSTKTERLDAT